MNKKEKKKEKMGGVKRGPWTAEEDEVLGRFVRKEGEGRWRTLPARAGLLRCGKSCRLRWMNYLRPSVKRGHISPAEEDLILRLHRLLGNRWSLIAGRIPGRTDNEIKNYWNTHLSKKLVNQGIDPRTHNPLPSSSPRLLSPPTSQDTPTANQSSQPKMATASHGENRVAMKASSSSSTHHLPLSHHVDDHGFNYCSDDAFSSFLDSLINDDHAFPNHLDLPDDHHPFL